jgi:hypothetical protein
MNRLFSALMGSAVVALAGIPAQSLAQKCTRSGWCLFEDDQGIRQLYRYEGRQGRYIYVRRQNIYPSGEKSEFGQAFDCVGWLFKTYSGSESGSWQVIVPGSIGNAIARRICP